MILCSWGLIAATPRSKVTELQSKLSGWWLMHTHLSQCREDRQPCFLNLPCYQSPTRLSTARTCQSGELTWSGTARVDGRYRHHRDAASEILNLVRI